MTPLAQTLHSQSPYDDFDPAAYPEDLEGWGSDDPIFRELIAALRPAIIVEVGTWKGRSAIHMASIAEELGLETQIICVDTWLGSPEHVLTPNTRWTESLRITNGYPRLYCTFLANVVRAGLSHRVIPLPNTSENAAVILRAKGIQPDLIYIDAAHEEDAAYRDLRLYWDVLAPEGVMLGDDYVTWEGVTRAANRFALEQRCHIVGKWGKFVLSRSPLAQPRIVFGS